MPYFIRFSSLLLVLALLFSCSKEQVKEPKKLIVTLSADSKGKLEPCGCFVGQFGGLSRISERIKRVHHDNKDGINLHFDVGDALAGSEDYNRILHDYTLKAFKQMNYTALNVGQKETELSIQQLEAYKQKSEVPILSANLLKKENNSKIFPSHLKLKADGYTISVAGVVDPKFCKDKLGEGLALMEMETAIEESLKDLSSADFKVLLAFTDELGLKALADKFYEFDLILGGKVQQPSQKLLKQNQSYVLYTSHEAKNLAYFKSLITEAGLSESDFNVELLVPDYPEDESILQLSKDYRQQISQAKLDSDSLSKSNHLVPGVEASSVYVGSQTCQSCHSDIHQDWSKTAHAHAFKSLKYSKSDMDPRCIKCHTVGFQESSGYQRLVKEEHLMNVGCESCHGPGSEHVRQRASGKKALFKYRPLGEGDCRSCHQGEFSRPFDWDRMWPEVKHALLKDKK